MTGEALSLDNYFGLEKRNEKSDHDILRRLGLNSLSQNKVMSQAGFDFLIGPRPRTTRPGLRTPVSKFLKPTELSYKTCYNKIWNFALGWNWVLMNLCLTKNEFSNIWSALIGLNARLWVLFDWKLCPTILELELTFMNIPDDEHSLRTWWH